MGIGENIKRKRKEARLTQHELSTRLGVSPAMISQYESGTRNPKIETLEKIANALKIPVGHLLDGCFESYREEYTKTKEWQKSKQFESSYYGVIKILEYIYGSVEEKALDDICDYYLIKNNDETFILFDDDIYDIVEFLESSLPFLINAMKKTESEKEIINEIRKDAMKVYGITSEENRDDSEE